MLFTHWKCKWFQIRGRLFHRQSASVDVSSETGYKRPKSIKEQLDMADFDTILSKIQTASQIVTAAEPAIEEYGTDHVAATQQLLQVAAAGVGAETNSTIAGEAGAVAELAVPLVPLFFKLFSLFKKKPAVVTTAASTTTSAG